jgi:hypothetical protein
MKLHIFAAVSTLAMLTVATAEARNYQLMCVIDNYGAANRVKGMKDLVPPRATHVIEGSDTQIAENGANGSAEQQGAKLKLHYVGKLPDIGDVGVDYVYFPSTNVLIVKTLSMRAVAWADFFPERMAQYIINGHCQSK